jgi:type IV fimbrial biogenesis protein FimT
MRRLHRSSGFTLVELVVVMAIMGVVMLMAMPAMRDFLANQRIKTASFNLITSTMFARSEAVKRAAPISIKAPSSNNLTNGWCVLILATADCSLTAPDTANTMRLEQPVGGVTYTFSTTAGVITFNRSGRLTSMVRIEVSDDELASLKRCITIDVGGNARSAVGACS